MKFDLAAEVRERAGKGPAWLSGGEPADAVIRVPTSEIQSRGQGTGGWYELLGSPADLEECFVT